MKKKQDYGNDSKQVRFKIVLAFLMLLLVTIFQSCSSEDDSVNESANGSTSKTANEMEARTSTQKFDMDLTQQSAISFSETVLSNYGSLDYALNKNLYVGFNQQAMQMLSAAQTEDDLKTVFEQAGIANSQEVLDVLKQIVLAQQNFIAENPNFYNLTQEQQMQYLNTGIEIAKTTYVNTQPVIPSDGYFTSPCARTYNTSIDRCNEDFGTCAVFAVAGAYAGIVPGLLAAAYCMTTKLSCDRRAKQDYTECLTPTQAGTGPDFDFSLTLHCNRDSCWVTNPSGLYVRKVE